jgi:hypothetical protein
MKAILLKHGFAVGKSESLEALLTLEQGSLSRTVEQVLNGNGIRPSVLDMLLSDAEMTLLPIFSSFLDSITAIRKNDNLSSSSNPRLRTKQQSNA